MTDPRLKPVGMTDRDWKLRNEETEQRRRAEAYPKLVAAIRELVAARDLVRTSVQHFHKNRAEVKRDSVAASSARALLSDLGEAP